MNQRKEMTTKKEMKIAKRIIIGIYFVHILKLSIGMPYYQEGYENQSCCVE
jgi:hypothetical protein